MALGMRSAELAAVGGNINRNAGGVVTQESIAAATEAELDKERQESLKRYRDRYRGAKADEAATKKKTNLQLLEAGKKVLTDVAKGVSKATAKTDDEKLEAKETRLFKKSDRLTKRADKIQGRIDKGKDFKGSSDRLARVRAKALKVGEEAKNMKIDREEYEAYTKSGSLYGRGRG